MTHNNHCTQTISSFAVPHKDIMASRSYKNLAVIHNCRHRIAYNLDGLTYRDATKEIVKKIKHSNKNACIPTLRYSTTYAL